MISFSFIPSDVRVPGAYVEFDGSKAVTGLPPAPQKILVIGQRLATGTTPALTPVRLTSKAAATAAFGRGSMGSLAFAALWDVNDRTETWGIGLDDAGGSAAATSTITVSGPSTQAGAVALRIAGARVDIGVLAAAPPATVATAIAAAVNANPDLPVTAAAVAAVVTLTARNKGTSGNDIDVRHSYFQGEVLPIGVGLVITAMAGGATDPDLAAVFVAIGDTQFPTLVLPFAGTATLVTVETELASRAGPMRAIEAMAYAGLRGTQGALAAIGAARNSMFVSTIGAKSSPSHPAAWAAAYAGQIAFHGSIDPARPFQTLPLATILPPLPIDRFTSIERDLLLRDGISTFTVDAGGTVLIERAITMYQTNAQGLEDIAWLDVNTPLTLFYLRLAVRSLISRKYPRHKLANDGVNYGTGQAIVTPRVLRAELIALASDLADAGLVENLAQFKADMIVERSKTDPNRVDALLPFDIVNQFRVFGARIEFRL